ncbi:MAG: AAA family ATPase [Pseudomonadota bacterium]
MILILFGLSGSGKNYVGEILKNKFDFLFYDADEWLTTEMQTSISNKTPFTQAMRDAFCEVIIKKTQALQTEFPNKSIVISQALYKEVNRDQINKSFSDILFIEVQSSTDVILSRLRKRGNWVDENYAIQISKNFEDATLAHQVIINEQDGDYAITSQLQSILKLDVKKKVNPPVLALGFFSNLNSDHPLLVTHDNAITISASSNSPTQ